MDRSDQKENPDNKNIFNIFNHGRDMCRIPVKEETLTLECM
jgi:hypothetical protein